MGNFASTVKWLFSASLFNALSQNIAEENSRLEKVILLILTQPALLIADVVIMGAE